MSSFFHAPFGDARAVLHVCIVSYSISLANLEHLTTTHAQFSLLPGLDSVVDRTLTSMLGSKMWRFPLGKRKIFEKKNPRKKILPSGRPSNLNSKLNDANNRWYELVAKKNFFCKSDPTRPRLCRKGQRVLLEKLGW